MAPVSPPPPGETPPPPEGPPPPETGARVDEAEQQYASRARTAERNFGDRLRHVLSRETLTRIAVLETLDLQSLFTVYSVADAYVFIDGLLDIIHAAVQKDLTAMERATGITKGALKIGAAALPEVPVAGIAPILDELLPTNRHQNRTPAEPAAIRTPEDPQHG